MATNTQTRRGNGGAPQGERTDGNERVAATLKAWFDSPLMREVLANALVAAAGAAAATLVRQRPESSDRVAKVAAAATAMVATSSRDEITRAGRRALGDFLGEIAKGAVPGMIAAVSGSGGGSSREENKSEKPRSGQQRQRKPAKKPRRSSSAANWQ